MRILIELPTWLGDCLMATPAIYNILKLNQKSTITFVGSKISVDILSNFPNLENSYIISRNFFKDVYGIRSLGNFDLCISFRSSIRSRAYLKLYQGKKKKQYFPENFLNIQHQVEKYNEFVNTIFTPGLTSYTFLNSLTEKDKLSL